MCEEVLTGQAASPTRGRRKLCSYFSCVVVFGRTYSVLCGFLFTPKTRHCFWTTSQNLEICWYHNQSFTYSIYNKLQSRQVSWIIHYNLNKFFRYIFLRIDSFMTLKTRAFLQHKQSLSSYFSCIELADSQGCYYTILLCISYALRTKITDILTSKTWVYKRQAASRINLSTQPQGFWKHFT